MHKIIAEATNNGIRVTSYKENFIETVFLMTWLPVMTSVISNRSDFVAIEESHTCWLEVFNFNAAADSRGHLSFHSKKGKKTWTILTNGFYFT